jgi:hypothetical protein
MPPTSFRSLSYGWRSTRSPKQSVIRALSCFELQPTSPSTDTGGERSASAIPKPRCDGNGWSSSRPRTSRHAMRRCVIARRPTAFCARNRSPWPPRGCCSPWDYRRFARGLVWHPGNLHCSQGGPPQRHAGRWLPPGAEYRQPGDSTYQPLAAHGRTGPRRSLLHRVP